MARGQHACRLSAASWQLTSPQPNRFRIAADGPPYAPADTVQGQTAVGTQLMSPDLLASPTAVQRRSGPCTRSTMRLRARAIFGTPFGGVPATGPASRAKGG